MTAEAPGLRVTAARDAVAHRAAQDLLLRFAEEAAAFGPIDVREEALWSAELYAPPEGGLWLAWRVDDRMDAGADAGGTAGPDVGSKPTKVSAVGLAALCADEAHGRSGGSAAGPQTAWLRRLYVVPAARGTGVGEALLAAAVAGARAAGYARVRADALPGMAPLYRSAGFEDDGPSEAAPGLAPARRMVLRLPGGLDQ